MGEAEDALVLRGHAYGGVDEVEDHVGPVDGLERLHHRILLDAVGDAPLASDTRGIDEQEALAVPLNPGVDGVAGGAGDVARQQPLLAEDAVDDARLAGVGAAKHGDPEHRLITLELVLPRQHGEHQLHDHVEVTTVLCR